MKMRVGRVVLALAVMIAVAGMVHLVVRALVITNDRSGGKEDLPPAYFR